jgi:NAD+--asparagine ADP-ribosyltransferase
MLKLMEKREMNDGWWINIVKLLRHNERIKTITARVKLASIKAIINKIKNMYNLIWTQPPSLLSTPLLHVPPPLQTQFLSVPPSLPPLRQSPSSLMEDNIKKWIKILEWVKKYIDEYKKRPTKQDKNEDVKTHGAWISTQLTNYQKKKQIMSNETIRELWEDFINDDKYKEYFLSNEEVWKKNLEFVKKYIVSKKKRPPQTSKNKNIKKHGQWLNNQLYNYKKQEQIMSNETIRHLWEDFINDDKYNEYFK